MTKQTEIIHNRLAGQIVASIVKPPLEAGGHFADVLVLLESVVLGVILTGVKLGGDERVLDEVVLHVKERLAQQLEARPMLDYVPNLELMAKAICSAWPKTPDGCAAICMDRLGSIPADGCRHALTIHGTRARQALSPLTDDRI